MKCNKEKQEEFSRIYDAYKNDIYRLAMHYAKDHDTAQEIMQEVFYKLYISYDEINPETVKALLGTITKNVYLNRHRDLQREVSGDLLDVVGEQTPTTAGVEDRYLEYQERTEKKELCGRIMKHLGEENPAWRDALIQVYYMKRAQVEVAEELGIGVEVLHARLYRARQWIRKNYQKEYDEITGWD